MLKFRVYNSLNLFYEVEATNEHDALQRAAHHNNLTRAQRLEMFLFNHWRPVVV